jgi:hypothetical protein
VKLTFTKNARTRELVIVLQVSVSAFLVFLVRVVLVLLAQIAAAVMVLARDLLILQMEVTLRGMLTLLRSVTVILVILVQIAPFAHALRVTIQSRSTKALLASDFSLQLLPQIILIIIPMSVLKLNGRIVITQLNRMCLMKRAVWVQVQLESSLR